MLRLFSILFLATAMLGLVGFMLGIFTNIGLAIISAVVAILGLFGWYVFRNLDSSFKEEARNQSAEN